MTSDSATSAAALAEVVDKELRERGSAARAEKEKAYLKSGLTHYGVSIPETRAVVRSALREVDLSHDQVVGLTQRLWAPSHIVIGQAETSKTRSGSTESTDGGSMRHLPPVHERRAAATMVLIQSKDRLGATDADFFEGLLREAKTWALVDPLAGDLIGPLCEQDSGFEPVLECWAIDEHFWIRRSALLAHLVPLRQGRGDFDRFSRVADAMLEEKEFFIRKAIGWVLRDTSHKRPDLVFDWILPRAHRASWVTIREAVKRLSPEQRDAVLAAR